MNFVESVDRAAILLEDASVKVAEATMEIGKYRHPVSSELAGIQHNIEIKIRRLQDLRRFEKVKK